MDVTLVPVAITALRFAKDALQGALNYKIENAAREQISAALEKLGSAQDGPPGASDRKFTVSSSACLFKRLAAWQHKGNSCYLLH
jgi:hypothetical protein